MVSILSISGLAVHAVIGVHSFEQSLKQKILIDLSFAVDIERAAARDLLSDTQDYAKICRDIISFVENTPCQLLETLTKKLSDYLKNQLHLDVKQLSVTKKPLDLPGVSVSVRSHSRA